MLNWLNAMIRITQGYLKLCKFSHFSKCLWRMGVMVISITGPLLKNGICIGIALFYLLRRRFFSLLSCLSITFKINIKSDSFEPDLKFSVRAVMTLKSKSLMKHKYKQYI